MWDNLKWHSAAMKLEALIDVVLEDRQSDARQEFEDMKEVSLGAVASGGKLNRELCGEAHWKHGWWVGSMEGVNSSGVLERGWNTVGSGCRLATKDANSS